MVIPAAMSGGGNGEKDGHEHDLVMPGFRFHPTEEELIEFYLRRKVEGKRFNMELIIFLDLYRYDPWELPAFATIGEKEWFFYVPRDRKYRNGDRPNRVTTSGYWKATGADKMIRSENSRPIGLKKTLVFYSGKAPKGVRTSWIMNEYRLPQEGTDRNHKAEISLCRVYKRGGVGDELSGMHKPFSSNATGPDKKHKNNHHPSTFFTTLTADSSSSELENIHEVGVCSGANDMSVYGATAPVLNMTTSLEQEGTSLNSSDTLVPAGTLLPSTSSTATTTAAEFSKMVAYHQGYLNLTDQFVPVPPHLLTPNSLATISDKLWSWNPLHDAGKDFTTFK
ncbi:NAC domain-containing protein 35-like [Phoenix dactylifera]|uniref:NAC domain-containing protein 35-like n=1 Tax=Phoenix dactylifera TaxID=42345 RepID=A0A8B7MT89_PHODC|nr:NAC domain-containing protein 35-like [Phoenix dactylifera]XP_038978020.1 NAC domain-containing protein 35-like [Phoenix dactylifera]